MFEVLLSNLKNDSPVVEFLGEVPTAGFINGEALASAIGLETGIAQHTDSPWLHFVLDGKTLYVAKRTYRYNLTWNQINAVEAVFGTKIIEIDGLEYKVRLLKSVASGDRYTGSTITYDPVGTWGSEWNRLMYSIHSGNHTDPSNPSPESGEKIRFGTLAKYTDNDLLLHQTGGKGSYSWCQETSSADRTRRVIRGFYGVSFLMYLTASQVNPNFGWRPVLELVR